MTMTGATSPILFFLKKSALESVEEGVGPFIPAMRPIIPKYFSITGITRNSAGATLPFCTVDLYRTSTKTIVDTVVSDVNGAFEFRTASADDYHYEVGYLAGSPDVAGTTVNTLRGV